MVNNESVDLDVNFIRYSIATAYKKYASYQNTELKPVYRFKQPKRVKGKQEKLPVYKFLKEPLTRKYGEQFYATLEFAFRDEK